MPALIATLLLGLFYYKSVESQPYNVRQLPTMLHLDVEPQGLANWWTQTVSISNQYLDLIDKVKLELSNNNSPLDLRMVIPFWWDSDTRVCPCRNGVCKQLADFVIDEVDNILVMDYRDTSTAIIDLGEDELIYADGLSNKNVAIAVETQCAFSASSEYITLCEEGATVLESELSTALTTFSAYNSFEGFAIHYYSSYKILSGITSTITQPITACPDLRGMYVWQTALITSADMTAQTALLNFACDHCIDTIYLATYPMLTNNAQQEYADFIDKAFDYGVKIELTMGAPDWALTGTHNWVLNTIGQVIDFVDDLNLVP